ncbi:unnamed protein product, partial [marine sediment metagenome]
GTQKISGLGFEPKVVIFWNTRVGSLNANAVHMMLGLGAAAGIGSGDQASISHADEDGEATSNNRRDQLWSEAIVNTVGTADASGEEGEVTAKDSDSFTITWNKITTNARYFAYKAIGGSDITDVNMSKITSPGEIGPVDYDIDFQPDALMVFGAYMSVSEDANSVTPRQCIGFYDGTNQYCAAIGMNDNVGTTVTGRRFFSDRIHGHTQPGSEDTLVQVEATAFLADGYRLDHKSISTRRFFVLAIKGGQWEVINDTEPVSDTTK